MNENQDKNIAIFCKDCRGMFFAAANKPNVLKDAADDIALYLKQGHIMKMVSNEVIRSSFAGCQCELATQLGLDLNL